MDNEIEDFLSYFDKLLSKWLISSFHSKSKGIIHFIAFHSFRRQALLVIALG